MVCGCQPRINNLLACVLIFVSRGNGVLFLALLFHSVFCLNFRTMEARRHLSVCYLGQICDILNRMVSLTWAGLSVSRVKREYVNARGDYKTVLCLCNIITELRAPAAHISRRGANLFLTKIHIVCEQTFKTLQNEVHIMKF